jgi:hypothetical protein
MHYLIYSPIFLIFVIFSVMWWFGKLPSITTLHGLAEIANTKGGIILLLYTMSFVFFFSGVHFLYWALGRAVDGKIAVGDGLITAGFAFLTGTAFGSANAAMLKTMTGDSTITPEVKSTLPEGK